MTRKLSTHITDPILFVLSGTFYLVSQTYKLPKKGIKRLHRGPIREIPDPQPLPTFRLSNLSQLDVATPPPSCRLLTLPPEIRAIIWDYCIGSHTHKVDVSEGFQPTYRRAPMIPRRVVAPHTSRCTEPYAKPLAILTTCRMTYQECVRLIYKNYKFDFQSYSHWSIDPTYSFTHFVQGILPQRVAEIRTVKVQLIVRNSFNFAWVEKLPKLEYLILALQLPLDDYHIFDIEVPFTIERALWEVQMKQRLETLTKHPTLSIIRIEYGLAMNPALHEVATVNLLQQTLEPMNEFGWRLRCKASPTDRPSVVYYSGEKMSESKALKRAPTPVPSITMYPDW